jgi:predicted metallopeptidase
MPKTSKKARTTVTKKKTGKGLTTKGEVRSKGALLVLRSDFKRLSDGELQKSITHGLRKIAATQRRSRRTHEEIVRLRKESRALLEKL